MWVPPEERLTVDDINMGSQRGEDLSRAGTRAAFSHMDQRRRSNRILKDNMSDDAIKKSGFSRNALSSLIQGGDIAEALRNDYQSKYEALKEKGIDIPALHNQYMKEIEDERLKGENDRIGLWDSLKGVFKGYFVDDPINIAANLGGGMVTLSRSALKTGGKILAGMLENALVEGVLTSELSISAKEKAKAIGMAGLAGGALPIIGKGASKVGDALGSVTKKMDDLLNGTTRASKVADRIEEFAESAPVHKEFLKDTAEDLRTLGGRVDKALDLKAEVIEKAEKGTLTPSSKFENVFYTELPRGRRVEASTLEEFETVLTKELRDMGEFSDMEVDQAVNDIINQNVVGDFDTYRILSDEIPLAQQKNVKYKRLDGTEQTVRAEIKPAIYDTIEEAEARLAKSGPDAGIVEQFSGKFAVVQADDTFEPLAGTARFATREKAEKELAEYANRYGIDEEDLYVYGAPSRSPDLDVDYVVGHMGPVRRPVVREDGIENVLDTLTMKTEKRLRMEPEASIEQSPKYVREVEAQKVASSDTVQSADLTMDQLALSSNNTSIKRLNAEIKAEKELLEEFSKCFIGGKG